jgi:hypothetical protein
MDLSFLLKSARIDFQHWNGGPDGIVRLLLQDVDQHLSIFAKGANNRLRCCWSGHPLRIVSNNFAGLALG